MGRGWRRHEWSQPVDMKRQANTAGGGIFGCQTGTANTFLTRSTNAPAPYDYPRMLYGCARSTATQTRERTKAAARARLD